jgi:hypothetical protein
VRTDYDYTPSSFSIKDCQIVHFTLARGRTICNINL